MRFGSECHLKSSLILHFVLHFLVQKNVADYIFPQLFVQKHILFYCTLI